ncbi:MAG: EamA family transporter, partial [Candidatus Eisenbacteria bacterium]
MNLRGFLHLLIVYVVWGSTYLAIRVAVRDESGFPPFFMAGARVLAGGFILWVWARLKKDRVRPTRAEWGTILASAALLWIGGNGAVVWGEQRVPSVYAALLVGALPLWVAIIEALLDRRPPTPKMIAALLLGFAGIAVISYPELRVARGPELLPTLALFLAPISWGIGSVIQQRRPVA